MDVYSQELLGGEWGGVAHMSHTNFLASTCAAYIRMHSVSSIMTFAIAMKTCSIASSNPGLCCNNH